MRWRKAGIVAGGVVAGWLVVLVILGVAVGGSRAERVSERLGEALQATATIEDRDLALVRGRFAIDHLRATRDDAVGKLTLDIGAIRCELAPLGLALVERSCRELAIGNVRLSLTSFALLKLRKPKRPPIRAGGVRIEDAELTYAPPALPKVKLVIEQADSGPTTFKTPLSWIFAVRTLRAKLELPIGVIELAYANGVLTATGIGSTAVTVPIALPVQDPTDEPRQEIERLVNFGREVAERLVAQKAGDWLRDKLPWR